MSNVKKPKWDECAPPKSITANDSKELKKILHDDSSVDIGWTVTARYKKWEVMLVITDALPNKEYRATIKGFNPVVLDPPSDLSEGDTVQIHRKYICDMLDI